jgi:hypothetical protein
LEWLTRGELQCVPREAARGDQDAAVRTLSRDDPKQLPHPLHWDLPIQPVLALDYHPFAITGEFEVNTTIRLAPSALRNGIALLAVGLTDQ